MFARLFDTLGATNTANTDVFGALEAQIHDICSVFWPLVAKITVFRFFLAGPSKNIGIYVVFSMLQEELFSCPRQKNIVNYRIFVLGKQPKNGKQSPKSVQNGPPKRILEF